MAHSVIGRWKSTQRAPSIAYIDTTRMEEMGRLLTDVTSTDY